MMNQTKKMAFEWLLKSYREEDIVFSSRSGPSFTCSDGKRFEPKKVYGSKVWISQKRFNELLSEKNVFLLAFRCGDENPVVNRPIEEIGDGKIFGGVIFCIAQKPNSEKISSVLEKKFRLVVEKRFGCSGDAVKKAREEAIVLWIKNCPVPKHIKEGHSENKNDDLPRIINSSLKRTSVLE